jgi:N-methylhydantoinase A
MLKASVAYEVARTLYQRARELDPGTVNAHIEAMREEAYAVVGKSSGGTPLTESRTAYMRYIGQGHEIAVPLEARKLELADRQWLQDAFEREYRAQFGRGIPGLEAEVLSWALGVRTQVEPPARVAATPKRVQQESSVVRRLLDPESGEYVEASVFRRADLASGACVAGPALIVEAETTTVVAPSWEAAVNAVGYLVLERRG